jgi:phosphoribosylformimino-5-aminoimidazole carboxamide ribotide isomerase
VRDGVAESPPGTPIGSPDLLFDAAAAARIETVVYRDLGRDGTLRGPALAAVAEGARRDLHVMLAGGVASLDDLEAARAAGAAGVIVGRALLEGRIDLVEAIACCG